MKKSSANLMIAGIICLTAGLAQAQALEMPDGYHAGICPGKALNFDKIVQLQRDCEYEADHTLKALEALVSRECTDNAESLAWDAAHNELLQEKARVDGQVQTAETRAEEDRIYHLLVPGTPRPQDCPHTEVEAKRAFYRKRLDALNRQIPNLDGMTQGKYAPAQVCPNK